MPQSPWPTQPMPQDPWRTQPMTQGPPSVQGMRQGVAAQQGPQGHQSPPPQAWSSRENLGLIVLLAVGLPLILLGGGAAVVMVLTDTGQGTVATEAGAPNMVMPSREPVPNQQPAEGVASEPPGGLAGQPTDAAGQPTGAAGQPTGVGG
ncbi:hypothetical protein ACBJ59_11120 [Nonomuraea sp. MTCD27]|uniref:hypothetical protein n=1 Tax=Nonomuraea sp. MTCD27 TaxID=1676747 RepID=UPI0035C16E37